MAKLPDYTRLTVTSMPDPQTGAFEIPSYIRDMKSVVNNAVKSALKENEFFLVKERNVNPRTGEMTLDIYVHEDRSGIAKSSMERQIQTFRGSSAGKYDVTSAYLSDRERRDIARIEAGGVETETSRFNKGTMLKILGAVVTLANITRRILSSVMGFASQSVQDTVTAHNLGVSYDAVRQYRHVETIHGLKSGTITGALSDIQAKFGNITSLDEKALESLAVVMGSQIEDMAKMGLGSSNPEKVLEAIIDAFNEKANAGFNSIGQYVGEQQARRELYSYLLKISPQMADIFATMQEEQHNINSLFRNQADTFAEWKNLLPTTRGGTGAQGNVVVTLGQEWNVIKDELKQIREAIALTLAPSLLKILRRIADMRIGLSEEENEALNKENKSINDRFIQSVDATLVTMGSYDKLSPEDKAKYDALVYFKKEAESANKGGLFNGNIRRADVTPDEIQAEAEKYLKQNMWSADGSSVDLSQFTKEQVMKVVEGNPQWYSNKEQVYAGKKIQFENQRKVNQANHDEVVKGNFLYLQKKFEEENTDKARIDRAYALARKEEQHSTLKASHFTNATEEAWFLDLLTASYLYPEFDFFHDESGRELDLYEAIKRARDEYKYVKSTNHGYKLAPNKPLPVITPDFGAMWQEAQARAGDVEDVGKFPEFWEWLLQNEYEWLLPRLQDNILSAQLRTADNSPTRDLQALFYQYGADLSGLSKFLPTGALSTVTLHSVNERADNGVIIHKILMDITTDGKTTGKNIVASSWNDNRETYSGNLMSITLKGDSVSYTNTQADGASTY